ncbi:MAG: hypothetical protein E6J25_01090 [Chloroflexi bacterium]|nr:MAG: hypothetical protein E6J25_01090 [Chloroflexota bacterium]
MRRQYVAAAAGALLVLVVGGTLVLASRGTSPAPTTAPDKPGRASPSPSLGTPTPSPQPTEDSRFHGVQATLPSCSTGALYSVSPIEPDKLSYILPLGNFTPLPSDHLYFVITRPSTTTPTRTVNLFAPGDITAFKIGRQVQTTNGTVVNTDYFLAFAACREVTGGFGHVSSFTGRLGAIAFDQCDPAYSIGDASRYQHCFAEVNIQLRAGEQIGTAGGKSSAALDFQSDDWRLPTPYVANPDHQYDFTASCALDYYQGDVSTTLHGLLGHGPGTHLAQGCGEIFQDKEGTLQGNWFNGTPAQTNGNIAKMLALAHENYDAKIGAISIGGTIAQRGEWRFDPTHSGTVNREFSEVIPGASIYCYQASGLSGRILIRLVTATTLTIEHQSSSCSSRVAFVNPLPYQR